MEIFFPAPLLPPQGYTLCPAERWLLEFSEKKLNYMKNAPQDQLWQVNYFEPSNPYPKKVPQYPLL